MAEAESRVTDYFAQKSELCSEDFPIGIGDDMAWMRFGGDGSALITTDMLLEGSHFDLAKCTLEQVGYKSMAVSLSDCAAMASVPFAAVASVGLPKGFGSEKLKELHAGILRAGREFGCSLVGGDITSWPKADDGLAVSITMLSKPGKCEPVRRTTAKAGDVICVTGALGGSLEGKHLDFTPRVKEAIRLTELVKLHSMMDISDGLSTDLTHICRLGGVGAVVEADMLPISEQAGKADDPLGAALNDGEDFELLFTLSLQEYEKLASEWDMETAITKVGVITETSDVEIVYKDGRKELLVPGGYDHLRG